MQIPMREPGSLPLGSGLVGPETAKKVRAASQKIIIRAQKIRLAWRLVLVGVLICSAAILWLSQTSTIVELGYKMEQIDKNEVVLNRNAELLNTEIGKLTGIHQIEKIARDKLGMVDASKKIFLEIPASSESAREGANTNPRLYQVSDWWRIVSQMLPNPWRDNLPTRPR
jgi:cell division protein FtsB